MVTAGTSVLVMGSLDIAGTTAFAELGTRGLRAMEETVLLFRVLRCIALRASKRCSTSMGVPLVRFVAIAAEAAALLMQAVQRGKSV